MRYAWFVILLGLGLACGTSAGPDITLDVTPDSLLVPGDTMRLSVTALDGEGHLVTGVVVTFESVDTSIATVSNVGLIRARTAIGRTIVFVNGGGTFTAVPVRVIPTPAAVLIAPGDTTIRTNATAPCWWLQPATQYPASSSPGTLPIRRSRPSTRPVS